MMWMQRIIDLNRRIQSMSYTPWLDRLVTGEVMQLGSAERKLCRRINIRVGGSRLEVQNLLLVSMENNFA